MELLIFIVALFIRFKGLSLPTPFWVDEFSTASQASQILKHGFSFFTNGFYPELNNVFANIIVSWSFSILGLSEFSARLPFAVFGALVPVVLYVLIKRYFGTGIALMAAMLTITSYFLIVWSRQARGYSLQALITIAIVAYYLYLMEKKLTLRRILTFVFLAAAGLFTHSIFILVLLAIVIDATFFRLKFRENTDRKSWLLLSLIGITILLFVSVFGYFDVLKNSVLGRIYNINNLWYYHSFLWREYGLITFLGFIGLIAAYIKRREVVRPILIFIILQLIFICFIWPPYASRYLVTIFPFMFFGVAVCIARLTKSMPIGILIVLFIIVNGYKFVPKPKSYYSINHDFREISNIDYNQIYDIIKKKGDIGNGNTAIIDTWHDRLFWYMGQSYPAAYLFRWINGSDRINGLAQRTDYSQDESGEKYIPDRPSLRFIGELSDLKRAMQKYPKGFLVVDDSSLPIDVIKYAQKNLKKELYIEHYTLDDNPYSVWPTTLYSWGIK